ncbi:hypothetical protein JFP838_pA0169 (plasmid) [Clostridium perfringens]|uniref:Uncharacterized protein n=1 Tax=Clostridium perfringens TaxID=1502 RepID=A0A140GRC6_CLOPF|nr:hypothetical protein JFP838_pA0169 [Clostridium perfringens]
MYIGLLSNCIYENYNFLDNNLLLTIVKKEIIIKSEIHNIIS